jgi:hypothetical protein
LPELVYSLLIYNNQKKTYCEKVKKKMFLTHLTLGALAAMATDTSISFPLGSMSVRVLSGVMSRPLLSSPLGPEAGPDLRQNMAR